MVKTEEVSILQVWVGPQTKRFPFRAPHLSFTQSTFIILSTLVVPLASCAWNSAWVALSSSNPPGGTQRLPRSSQTRAWKPLTLSQRRRVRILSSAGAETAGGADARPQETWLVEVSGQNLRRPSLKRQFVLHLIQ